MSTGVLRFARSTASEKQDLNPYTQRAEVQPNRSGVSTDLGHTIAAEITGPRPRVYTV